MLWSPSCQIRIFPTHQCILEVAQVPVCVTQPPVGPVLVPQAPSLESQGQELLVVPDTLTQLTQSIVTISQVAKDPGLLSCPRLGSLLQTPQLRLKVADGLLEVAEVHPGDAHVPEGLGLPYGILELPGPLKLLLEAPEGQGVVAEAHVDSPEVAVCPALPAGVSNVLEYREFLK